GQPRREDRGGPGAGDEQFRSTTGDTRRRTDDPAQPAPVVETVPAQERVHADPDPRLHFPRRRVPLPAPTADAPELPDDRYPAAGHHAEQGAVDGGDEISVSARGRLVRAAKRAGDRDRRAAADALGAGHLARGRGDGAHAAAVVLVASLREGPPAA